MVTQLTIQNFGLIDNLSLEFCDKLNILTGETGAGKSIIIDALRFALGDQLNASQIRNPALSCTVEVVFELADKELRENEDFCEYLPDGEKGLIINRTHAPDGKKKIKVNGFAVTLSQLKELGNHLVDFHGPNDHQMLLSADSHLAILDRLTDFGKLKEEYTGQFKKYSELRLKLKNLHEAASSWERDCDLLGHQIKELEQVPLEKAKYEHLLQEQTRLNNVTKLYECASLLLNALENDDSGVAQGLSQAFTPLKTLNKIDSSTEKFTEKLNLIQENAQELIAELTSYLESLSFEPQEAAEINKNCDIYQDIMRKYGPGLDDAARFYQEAKQKYDLLANLEQNDAALRQEILELEKELKQVAQKISKQRKKAAKLLEETIEKELTELGIVHVQFECRISKVELNSLGEDGVSFYISPNAGEDLKPLAEIVSSGEAARLMLALKKALTKVDPIPVLIFDEIDAQIGGRLGTITGKKLQEISRDRQVILITHLPQIASFADNHFRVYKKVKDNHTTTIVDLLSKEEQVKEMAKMMSGEKESSISLAHAQDMLAKAKK
ncbi:MAG: DNA repair protein RecN [Candidatus Omnitrophota bacterium]|jgi:DNA repair protein RecN (Recombination protein N)